MDLKIVTRDGINYLSFGFKDLLLNFILFVFDGLVILRVLNKLLAKESILLM